MIYGKMKNQIQKEKKKKDILVLIKLIIEIIQKI